MRVLKYVLYSIGALAVLAIVAALALALLVDANRFKGPIERAVKEATQRRLTLEGPLHLAFFPSIGLSTGRAILSERDSSARFASVQSAQISVSVLPLLRGALVVNGVQLDGLRVDLVRYKSGRSNYEDLLPRQAAAPASAERMAAGSAPALRLDIASIRIEHSALSYRDEKTGRSLELTDFALRSGRIAPGVQGVLSLAAALRGKNPALDLRVKATSGYRIGAGGRAVSLSGLDAQVSGSADGASSLALDAKGDVMADLAREAYDVANLRIETRATLPAGSVEAKLEAPKLGFAGGKLTAAEATATLRLESARDKGEAKLRLSDITGSASDLAQARIGAEFDFKLGEHALKGTLSGPLRVDSARNEASAQLAGSIDESKLKADLALAPLAPPHFRFDVDVDRLNLDRYLGGARAGSTAGAASLAKAAAGPSGDTPIDFSALKGLNADGRLRIGVLTVHRITLSGVKAQIRAANGRLEVSPYSAVLYQGTLAGELALDARGNKVALKDTLSNVSVGPLVRDLAARDALEGRGNVALDVTASGPTVNALKKSLAGSARVHLRDGAIKGINLAATLRKAKALLGAQPAQEQAADRSQQTDFSELSASFAIRGGVAHNEDLSVKSPFFRISGAGDIDLGDSRLDYLAKATVLASAHGQGGAELAQLAGLTVPVRLTGPFDAPKYHIDLAALAADLAKSRLGESLEKRLEGKPGQGGAAKELLRGIFGR